MLSQMRLILLLLTIVLIISCKNKKVEIVERQKAIKNRLKEIQLSVDSITIASLKFDSDMDSMDIKKKVRLNTIRDSILIKEQTPLEDEYDSLEMELKKY